MNADLLFNAGVALSSALIGGGLTLMGVVWTLQEQKREAKEKEAEYIKALLQAFHTELETLWGVYKEGIGASIENMGNNEPMYFSWPLTLEYFTVYNTNAGSIGRIRDRELRKQIITTYTKARTMIDAVRMNNELLQEWERDKLSFSDKAGTDARFERLVDYAKTLKQSHLELESMALELLQHLEKNPPRAFG